MPHMFSICTISTWKRCQFVLIPQIYKGDPGGKYQVNWVGICPPSKSFCPPSKLNLPTAQNCPPSKLSCPQEKKKMWLLQWGHLHLNLCKLTNPKLKTLLEHLQNRQCLSVVQKLVNILVSLTLTTQLQTSVPEFLLCISQWSHYLQVKISQNLQGKYTIWV